MELETAGAVVLETLTRACSQDTEVLKPAEQQLKQWEIQPGFYTILLNIFSNHSIDVNVRFLAVLYFKNGVDRYWRKNAPNAICEQEKDSLKRQLISNFNEPISQIATQLAVLIAKVARLECPRNWLELVPTLLGAVKCDNALLQQRALLTFYHVIKALASKRLGSDRKMFEELTNNLFGFIFMLWKSHTSSVFDSLQSHNTESIILHWDQSILSLKVLRKLAVFGFKNLSQHQVAMTFLTMVFQCTEQFLECKNNLARELLSRREKIITLFTKALLDVREYHPESFVTFIRPSLELATKYNFSEEGREYQYERFAVNTFNLVRSILRCEVYRPAKTIAETKDPLTIEAHKIKMGFFTQSMLSEICQQLILRYFPLTMEDLLCWDADPEDFVSDETGDAWKFSLRPCTENLYLTLVKEFRVQMTPLVLSLVQKYQLPADPGDLNAILQKDAVYVAIGQASFDFYDEVDFDEWFKTHLLLELQNQHNHYRIIRRRVIWLIGCWIGVKLSTDLRPVLYQAILPLLQAKEDLVVRIEAALTLKIAVDDFEFKTEPFLPYLEQSFGLLFQLLKEVSECETKMQVLHVMCFIIERMRREIRPHAAALIQYLPSLWQESADHNMLRCAILTTLTNLVEGLGELCVDMYDFLLPVIQLSTDVTQEPHVYLCEDGLELWRTALHCSPCLTPGLIQLYANMPDLFEMGTETLPICLRITEAYILLGPKDFLEAYSSTLTTSLCTLLTDIRTEAVVIVYKVVEAVLQVLPKQGPNMFSVMLMSVFKAIVEKDDFPAVVSIHLSLISRTILNNLPFFWSLNDQIAKSLGRESSDILGTFLDSWLDKMENVIMPEKRKLCALALASFLSSNISVVLERFPGIICLCVETLHDVCRCDENGTEIDCLVRCDEDNLAMDELETDHDKRKTQLALQDPIHKVSLRDHLFSQLSICQQQHGHAGFQQLMDSVDWEISQQLQNFMK